MATPFPNPEDARKKKPGGARRPRTIAAPLAVSESLIPTTQVTQGPSKVSVEKHAAPGPSGIKQCFRSVKSTKRIALHTPQPPSMLAPPDVSTPSTSTSASPVKKLQHVCKLCSKRFNTPEKLNQHALTHTGDLPYACPHCQKKFNSKFKLVRHELIHNETRPFSCTTCHKTFHRKDHLVNHQRTHNPTKVPFKCDRENCNKQYTSLLSYKKHSALHSAEEGNLDCKICSKTFDKKEDIVYHLKVHAGSRTVKKETDKKFSCTTCERKFFTRKDVKRHFVVHTGSRDFTCEFCSHRFGRKDHLVRHMKKAHPTETKRPSTSAMSSSQPGISQKPSTYTPVSRKGKGEGKKSKVKPESSKRYQAAEQQFSFKVDPVPLIVDVRSALRYELEASLQPPFFHKTVFLPSEELQIKPEPTEENVPSGFVCEPLPSTSKDVPFIESSPTQIYPEEIEYIYPSNLPEEEIITQEELFFPRSETELLPIIEAPKDPSDIIEEPITSLLEEKPEFPSQSQQEQQKTVLPTFRIAFPSTAQSPKPPQPPPK